MQRRHKPQRVTDGPGATVIICNYNYAAFLSRAIDSVLSQTHPFVETIVVDDGSTDESPSIIAAYADRIIPLFKSNGGMASATNAGFALARGEFVVFLDADDVLMPDALETIATEFADVSVSKVHWPLEVVNADGEPTGAVVPARRLREGDLLGSVIRGGPMVANGPPTSGNAWPRWLLEKLLPMPEEELRQHADAYLSTLAPLYGKVVAISRSLACYRAHSVNDYATRPLLERLRRNRIMYAYRSELLARHLQQLGHEFDRDNWMAGRSSYPTHLERRLTTLEAIAELVPPAATFILVDGGAFGSGPLITDRHYVRLPLTPPSDDVSNSIFQLEAAREQGARFLVFSKPVLWWYRDSIGLRNHFESRYCCELANDSVIVFDLTKTFDSKHTREL